MFKTSAFSWVAVQIFVAFAAITELTSHSAQADSSALPGQVYRDYLWRPKGKMHVVGKNETPITFARGVDREHATGAQVIIEMSNQHLGYPDLSIRIDGGPFVAIAFPQASPAKPDLYYHHWNPAIELPLSELSAKDEHQFEMHVGAQRPGGQDWHPPWNPVYSVTLRIFYDAARKAHAPIVVSQPQANQVVTERVNLQTNWKAQTKTAIHHIDFVGRYRDVDYEGDGTFDGWHGRLKDGALERHLGTAYAPGETIVWDASWVPDQTTPMAIAARVVDSTGLTYVTEAVTGLTLSRPGFSVELAANTAPPTGFTACQYGTWIDQGPRIQKLEVKTQASNIIDAQVAFAGWNAPPWRRFSLNGVWLEEARLQQGAGNHLMLTLPLRPLVAIHTGMNELATIPEAGRQMDVFFPGVQLLLRSTTSKTASTAVSSPPLQTNSLGMAFVEIHPGFATVGSPEHEEGHVWEDRLFRAEVTKPYFIGTTEVTQAQFAAVMGFNPSEFRAPSHPVENVSWNDAVEFCERLSKRDKRHYRLPTEVEWEMAARAGTQTPFSFGMTPSTSLANYDGRDTYGLGREGINRDTTTPVGTFAPNPWGLYDVHGNVWEWCSDWYAEYPKDEAIDWKGPDAKGRLEGTRILRGGAFNQNPRQVRSSFRHRLAPEATSPTIGFRIVWDK